MLALYDQHCRWIIDTSSAHISHCVCKMQLQDLLSSLRINENVIEHVMVNSKTRSIQKRKANKYL